MDSHLERLGGRVQNGLGNKKQRAYLKFSANGNKIVDESEEVMLGESPSRRLLQTMDLSSCSQLGSLPAEIGQLTALQTLDLCDCSQLKSLPAEIGQLTALQTMVLKCCSQLERRQTSATLTLARITPCLRGLPPGGA